MLSLRITHSYMRVHSHMRVHSYMRWRGALPRSGNGTLLHAGTVHSYMREWYTLTCGSGTLLHAGVVHSYMREVEHLMREGGTPHAGKWNTLLRDWELITHSLGYPTVLNIMVISRKCEFPKV